VSRFSKPKFGDMFGSRTWAFVVVGRNSNEQLLCLILNDDYCPNDVGTIMLQPVDFVAAMPHFSLEET
jgi:hypothetical protein